MIFRSCNTNIIHHMVAIIWSTSIFAWVKYSVSFTKWTILSHPNYVLYLTVVLLMKLQLNGKIGKATMMLIIKRIIGNNYALVVHIWRKWENRMAKIVLKLLTNYIKSGQILISVLKFLLKVVLRISIYIAQTDILDWVKVVFMQQVNLIISEKYEN